MATVHGGVGDGVCREPARGESGACGQNREARWKRHAGHSRRAFAGAMSVAFVLSGGATLGSIQVGCFKR